MSETLFDQLRDSVAELVDERRSEGGILDRGIERLESAINAETSLGGFIGEHLVGHEADQPPVEQASQPVAYTPEAIVRLEASPLSEADQKILDEAQAQMKVDEAFQHMPPDLIDEFYSREDTRV